MRAVSLRNAPCKGTTRDAGLVSANCLRNPLLRKKRETLIRRERKSAPRKRAIKNNNLAIRTKGLSNNGSSPAEKRRKLPKRGLLWEGGEGSLYSVLRKGEAKRRKRDSILIIGPKRST